MNYREMWSPRKDYEFVNWAENQRSRPKFYHQPRTEVDVVHLVNEVRDRGETVRCVGAGHSWSDIACTEGNLVNLDYLDQVLEVDYAENLVTVEAGIRLKHLVKRLEDLGLAMPNLGSIMEQSIAGATATGTHGTGLAYGNLSTAIAGMRLVTGTGEVLELNEDDDESILRAARVSIGALGIVTRLTLRCEEHYDLHEKTWALPFDLALEAIPRMIDEYERVKFWWMPHTDRIYVFVYRKTTEPRTEESPLEVALDEFINDRVFPIILGASKWAPRLVPLLNRVVASSYFQQTSRVGSYEKMLTLAMPPKHLEIEYGIPVEHTVDALREARDIIQRKDYRIGFIQELRFVKGDDNWLSCSHGHDTFQFGVYAPYGRDARRYFKDFADMAVRMGGRPHWGKEFDIPSTKLRELFPKLEEFDALRRKLDPDGIFENAFVERVFEG